MSYMIFDSNGYVGDLASNAGLQDMARHLMAHAPQPIRALIEDGTEKITPEFIAAFDDIPKASDTAVNTTVENLKQLATKCKDIVIISDGLTEDDEEGEQRSVGKFMFPTQAMRDDQWREFVVLTDTYERKMIETVTRVLDKCKAETLTRLSSDATFAAFDRERARNDYVEAVTPLMVETLQVFSERAKRLVVPKGVPYKGVLDVLSQFAKDWLRNRISWAAAEVSRETYDQFTRALQEGFEAGDSIDKIRERIEESFGASPARAERIARTEILGAANQGSLDGYKSSGVVERVEWLTARDERTCDICDPMEGETFPIDDFPTPPASTHPNCRCTCLPIIT